MRKVAFESPCTLILKDSYNNERGRFEIKDTLEVALQETTNYTFYEDLNTSAQFFIYHGQGTLESAHAQIAFNLRGARVEKIEKYLLGEKVSLNRAERDFLEIYDLNIAKNAYYIAPREFLQLEQRLLNGF